MAELRNLDPNYLVLLPGYEYGADPLTHVNLLYAARTRDGEDWWAGDYSLFDDDPEGYEDNPEKVVYLHGKHNPY